MIGVLLFLFNVGVTMIKAKRWTAIQATLLGGLVFLAVLYLFGIPFYQNLTIDWYYWWWVIHLWVEGAWELVTAAIFAWVLMKITGVERGSSRSGSTLRSDSFYSPESPEQVITTTGLEHRATGYGSGDFQRSRATAHSVDGH